MNPTNWQHLMAAQRDLIAGSKNDDVRACGEKVLEIIDYLSRGDAVFKEFIRLSKESPEIFTVLRAFPGAQIESVREIENA